MSLEFSLCIVVLVALQHIMQRKLFNRRWRLNSYNFQYVVWIATPWDCVAVDEQPSEIWPACNSYHSVLYNFRFQRKLSRGIVFGQSEVVPQIAERGITVGANGSSSSIKASIRSQVILSGNIQQPGASWCELLAQTGISRCKGTSGPPGLKIMVATSTCDCLQMFHWQFWNKFTQVCAQNSWNGRSSHARTLAWRNIRQKLSETL